MRAGEPVNGIQHQPVSGPVGWPPAAPQPELSPEMQYRRSVAEAGVRAADANLDKLVAAGMTDTPKVRFNNSILQDVEKQEAAADKAANARVVADPNAGAPDTPHAEVPKAAAAPAQALAQKMDTIGEPKYDYSVYDFSHRAIYDPLEAQRREEGPYSNNGYAAKPWSLAQRNKNDISDKNIDEEVVGFVRADKNTVPIPLARRDSAYPINGWDNKPPSRIDYAQRSTKDISDKNIDEEVVGFVRADKNMMPIPQFARRETAYPVNGWANTPPSTVENLAQRNAKDISDKNIDEEVVGFVRADKNMMPIPQFARRETAYPVNGWANTPPSQALSQKKVGDISQPGVEPNVYDFVHDKVEALNWPRRPEPYNDNGYKAGSWSLAQQQDIADKEVRPDVYVTVKRMVDPAAHWRSDKAPKDSYQPYVGVQEPYPKAEAKKKEPAADGLEPELIQTQFLGNPERVNVLDPIAYQTRANGNTIDGGIQIRRTTFY